jgi:6-phosphogluconate dehydrogenase
LCSKLSKPRKIVILDASGQTGRLLTIAALSGHMEGDVIIDGATGYPNSIRRSEELAEKSCMF